MRSFVWMVLCLLMVLVRTAPAAGISGEEALAMMGQGKAKEALAAFEVLAEEGDARAMTQLGLYYCDGLVVKQDYQKANDWWLRAFQKQNADAFVNLGVSHRDGRGVPVNKKIAYCVFLTTHMCGLGSQSTQLRSNSCLRRIMDELSKDDIRDVLSNYTLGYLQAYIEARGNMKRIPDEYKPSADNPALKDTGWWLDEELDAIFGPPSKDELAARQKKKEERRAAYEAVQHTLTFQLAFADDKSPYDSYTFVTGMGLASGAIEKDKIVKADGRLIFEESQSIVGSPKRFVAIEDRDKGICLVYEIKHPVKPEPVDWSQWQKPDFALGDGMDVFTLMGGGEPKSKSGKTPDDAPLLRFKVEK